MTDALTPINTQARKIRVPIQPLLDYIANTRGVLFEFFQQEEVWVEHTSKGGPFGDKDMSAPGLAGHFIQRVHPSVVLEFERHQKRIERAVKKGWLDYFFADELCCDVFHLHPVAVFGSGWFDYADDEALQDRLAGRVPAEELAEEAMAA